MKSLRIGVAAIVALLGLAGVTPAMAQVGGHSTDNLLTDDVTVEPTFFHFDVPCGCCVTDSICVILPPGTVISAADILFILDVTGSMTEELEEVKDSAIQIMTDIANLGIDAQFGVGSFSDYPGTFTSCGYTDTYAEETDYPWSLDQDITGNTAAVAAAINALTLKGGWDLPEDYTRALWETQFFTFRPGTKKIVLMFGDAPTHDCGFLAYTLGTDPGPDATANTGDDLDYETVVAQLAAAGITVISIDSSGEPGPGFNGAWENMEYMAVQTGGAHYLLAQAEDIPQAIVDLITEQAEEINWLTLLVDPTDPYDAWFSHTPDGYADAVGPDTLCFEIAVHPVNTPVGLFSFDIVVDGDGAELARATVEVYVTGASAVDHLSWGQLRKMFYNK